MAWYWVIGIGLVCLIAGWSFCAMLGCGKVSDLEFELMMERRNRDHWKNKYNKMIGREIANTDNERIENLKEEQE